MEEPYLFLDPNDNSRVIVAFDTHGFIPPGENENFGFFDPGISWRFQIENTGDAAGDLNFDTEFSPQTGRDEPQTATVMLNGERLFSAPTTPSDSKSSSAPAPVITTDRGTGITLFAGLTDDPFFFDVPAELRYRQSRFAGNPDPSVFSTPEDSFAGFNVTMLALSIPAAMIQGPAGDIVGLACYTRRNRRTSRSRSREDRNRGQFINIDRMGVSAINTVLLPFARKDEYNKFNTRDDATGRFADDIVSTLKRLLTDETNIGILASVVVTNGDMLRLNLTIPNTGPGGGNNPEAGFPNGRRPADDTIDTIVTFINNQQPVDPNTGRVDNVNANDVPFRNSFPFFAPPHQPS